MTPPVGRLIATEIAPSAKIAEGASALLQKVGPDLGDQILRRR